MVRGTNRTKPQKPNSKKNSKGRKKKKSSKGQRSMELLFSKMMVSKTDYDPSKLLGHPSNIKGSVRKLTKTGLDSAGNGYYQNPEPKKPD